MFEVTAEQVFAVTWSHSEASGWSYSGAGVVSESLPEQVFGVTPELESVFGVTPEQVFSVTL